MMAFVDGVSSGVACFTIPIGTDMIYTIKSELDKLTFPNQITSICSKVGAANSDMLTFLA